MMKFEEFATASFGFLFICVKAFVTTSGYKHFIESGLMLITFLLASVMSYKVSVNQGVLFRTLDPGLWACLLLPSVANGVDSEDRCLLYALVLITLIIYLWKAGFNLTKSHIGLSLVVYISLMWDMLLHKPADALSLSVCCIGYMLIMNNLHTWFKRSFTFGEASIIGQLYVSHMFREVRTLFTDKHTESLEKAEVVVFVGLHIAIICVWILAQKHSTPLLLWPATVIIGLVYLFLALFMYMDGRDIEKILHSIILTQRSAVLLCWWSLWLLGSVLIVCFHGNRQTLGENKKFSTPIEEVCKEKYSKESDNTDIPFENTGEMKTRMKEAGLRKTGMEDSGHGETSFKGIGQEKIGLQETRQTETEYKEISLKEKEPMKTRQSEFRTGTSKLKEESGQEEEEVYKQIDKGNLEDYNSKHKSKFSNKKSDTKTQGVGNAVALRKYFHLAMIFVYIPGLVLAPRLLFLASILVAALFIFLEFIRVLNIDPVGPMLNKYLWVFLDEQDTGDLILTPIYLLLGCSLPIWWNYKLQKAPCSLSMYSGLISVGVGDGIASVIGRKYGRHKWPGSKKSLEGTAAAILSQIIIIKMLSFINISGAVVTMETVFCIILISLLEAFTNQIDNLVVPVFAWVLFATVEPTY